ncbi:TM2 domain-containing protein CG10795 [Aplysia californica]|uniref:TM2 domain-containing protein CG10795 n=1 Tax=Aplysia californica TaxID=6500 RepID=A0ABM0K6Q3_APLCA|nr:TM2 domain-containing protein CG10795 [Aplysia californica]
MDSRNSATDKSTALNRFFRFVKTAFAFNVLFSVLSLVVPLFFQVVADGVEDGVGGRDGSWSLQKCTDLLVGQYLCSEPDIDPDTQQARGCTKESKQVLVWCSVAPGVDCDGLYLNGSFQQPVPCQWTNGHSFETALLLSVFLGMFGVDRFYLGYPAIGLVKFATLGFMFLGQLIDILLIATQVLTPSDGSAYVLDYFGAATTRVMRNNDTYLKPGH